VGALRTAVFGTALVGLLAVGSLAVLASTLLAVSPLYVWKAAGSFALIAAIVIAKCERHHPFSSLGPANQVTMARAVIVALLIGLIGEPAAAMTASAATAASLIALLMDGVDGSLARRSRMASAFGARFDMEIDALLILVLSILVWQYDRAGAWIVLAGLLRYLFVAAGWLLPWMRRPLEPSLRRQAMCVVQIAGLLLALTPMTPGAAAAPLAASALAALVWSFLVDTLWLWRSDGGEQVA
jgi:phosphatidylglycerophosphate synthase